MMKDLLNSINSQVILSFSIFEKEYYHLFKVLRIINNSIFWVTYLLLIFFIGKLIGEIFFLGIIESTWDFLFSTPLLIMVFFIIFIITGWDK